MSDDGSVAGTVVAPSPTAMARPREPALLEIVANPVVDADHVTTFVRSRVLGSE